MKKSTVKPLPLLLSTLLLLSACGQTTASSSDDVTYVASDTVTDEVSTQLQPDLPDVTFHGAEIRFLSREIIDTVVRYYSEIASEEQNGEIMNDATYQRTVRIEEKYDVNIVNDTVENVTDTYKTSYLAGDNNWDVIVDSFSRVMPAAIEDRYFADLNQVPYVDLTKPWWDTRVAEELSIGGRCYAAIGAMNTWTDSHTYAVVFNKEMAEDYSVTPYAMVDNNTWTLDNFAAQLKNVTSDIDGNGVMDHNDRYGTASEYFNFMVHMVGCGANVVTHDSDGIPVYNITEQFYTAAEKVNALMNGGDCLIAEAYKSVDSDPWTNVIRKSFRAGNCLFYVGGIEQLLIFRDLETDIGLLPMPKYDADSDYAHTFNVSWSSIMAVPSTGNQQEMTGILLEAMNADSYYSTSVAYYDVVLKNKAMRDEDSVRMLEIIRSSRTMNFEYAFACLGLRNIYNTMMKNGGIDTLASTVASALPGAVTKLANLMNEQ